MNKPCPFCGQEPLMYKGKKSGELWVHCHNGSYKGVQGVECPIADHNFTVDEWNYRPHEEIRSARSTAEIIDKLRLEKQYFIERLGKLMYWMDRCREGQEIDIDKFNKFWEECQEVIRNEGEPSESEVSVT